MSNVDDDIDKNVTQMLATYLEGLHNPNEDGLYNELRAKRDTENLKQAITTLLEQAEIKARIDELIKLKKAHSITIFDEYLENHIKALEKEIV